MNEFNIDPDGKRLNYNPDDNVNSDHRLNDVKNPNIRKDKRNRNIDRHENDI